MNVKCRKCGLYNNSQQEAQCRRCGIPIEEVYSSNVTRIKLDNLEAPNESFSLFNSNGRVPRKTYWMFYICFVGINLLLAITAQAVSLPSSAVSILLVVIIFPSALIGLFIQIKRWHDRDKSGWWVLINFIPVIGPFWTFVECGLLKGTDGANRFGSDPLEI